MIKIGSLFSGIGGFELGVEYALNSGGIETQVCWQVEIDPFCQKVLEKHWPNSRRYSDITTLNPAELEPVDLVIGGFPCQDISQAGFGEGINGSRSGLFYELMRIVRSVGSPFVLLENVPAITISNRGLGSVLGELANAGFNVQWESISAADCGAPHKRSRWFGLGYSNSLRELQQKRAISKERGRLNNASETTQLANAHKRICRSLSNSSTPSRIQNPKSIKMPKASFFKLGGSNSNHSPPKGSSGINREKTTEPRMGGNLNGISPRLDLFKFPKGRGLSQFDW